MNYKVSKTGSLEKQVTKAIDFMSSHEWTGPIALPIYLHEDLDKWAERYLFESYISMNYAHQNYMKGDYVESKKRLGYSLMFKDEAMECSHISGLNDFSALLFNKTDEFFNKIILNICSYITCSHRSESNYKAGFFGYEISIDA